MRLNLPRSNKGFTLIELMVVVGIIAIISVVAVALFGNAQKQARDGKRVAELEAIANAFELNKTTAGYIALQTNQFASDALPSTDPSGWAYCISNAGSGTANPTTAWNTTTCPTGFTQAAAGVPTAVNSTYKICVSREIQTPAVFCRTNQQ